jgi:two-component system, OmpR family, response regulator CpxR
MQQFGVRFRVDNAMGTTSAAPRTPVLPKEVSARLLLIDDDEKLCRLLRDYLVPLGYSIDSVHNGSEGLERARNSSYGAIILDVMLPGMNGFDVLRRLRETSNAPVLMLSALGDEADRIAGLEIGADDYLPKAFSTRELLARLRAVLRRSFSAPLNAADPEASAVSLGGLWLDPGARIAKLDGQALSLTPIEYDILLSLAKAPGRVKTRERLLLEVADRDFESFDRSIDVHVSSLRRRLGDDPKTPRFIETVRGVGYRMRRPGEDP